MATRTYVTCASPGTLLRGDPYGDWSAGDSDRDNRGLVRFVFLLAATKTNGGVVTSVTSGNAETAAIGQNIPLANQDGCAIWVTPTLAAGGTFSGTITLTLKVAISAGAGAAGAYHVYAYISQGDTLTQRTVILDNVTDATAWTSTATWRSAVFTPVAASWQAGDRIVFELGSVNSPDSITGNNTSIVSWGTTDSSDTPYSDATNGSTGTGAAWLEFADTLTFTSASAPPANDACADATVIATLPYQSAVIDSTGSTDTNKSIWWTWTADVGGRVFGNVWGGNYFVWLRGWQGGCGALSLIQLHTNGATNSNRLPWVGTSQSAIWFDAVAGTQYWFQLASNRQTLGSNAQFAAKDSGGAAMFALYRMAAPETGDLFVNCQHIVAYRDGQPVNCLSDFYGDTPTNSTIDYTHRPMNNLNGGINTSLRLNVNLFGDAPVVEVLDLTTLNVGEQEIDFISDPLNYSGHSNNASSVVIDPDGKLVIGYFGDHYSVLGTPSTAQQCRVNRIDATHADNQTGAPWANAEAFTVEQQNSGSDYVELSSDGTTLYYTSAGTKIFTYDLTTSTQGTLFATLPAQDPSVPRPGARGLRLLGPTYTGMDGLIVAYGNSVLRLDSTGTVVRTYTPSDPTIAQDLDKVELTPDGQSFWVSDQYSTHLFQFHLDSGAQTDTFATNLPPGQLCGFTVLGYRGFTPTDLGDPAEFPLRIVRRAPIVSDQEARIYMSRGQLVLQAGIGTTTGQGSNPQVMRRVSRDGGFTFGSEEWRSAGRIGQRQARVLYYLNGQARNRVDEFVVSDPAVPWTLVDYICDFTKGNN